MEWFDKKTNDLNKDYKLDTLRNIQVDKYSLWREVVFSDVMNFDSNNYVIFTHSVRAPTKLSEVNIGFKNRSMAYSPSDDYFNIAFNPYDLKKKKRISVAFTTSEDNYTYGRIGYVVSAPIENILYVGQAPLDKNNDELRQSPLKTPQEAQRDMFREVVLEGSTIYGKVEPVAIFINLTDATEEEIVYTMYLLEQIKKSTGEMLPILDLSVKDYTLENDSGKKLG